MIFSNKFIKNILIGAATILVVSSCNKEVEQFPEIEPVTPAGKGLAATIAANATDSLFYRLIIRAGMVDQLNNLSGGNYSIFVPDNDAMLASGLNGAAVNGMPLANAVGIVQYNIIPQKVTSSMITTAFPNKQYPTMIILDPTNHLVRMTTFLSKNGTQNYVNNIPLGTVDIAAANGVIHKPLRLVAPPSTTLKGAIAAESNLSYFRAAIAKADSAQTGLNRFDSLLNYGVTNMTVFAPNDAAFPELVYKLSFKRYIDSIKTTKTTPVNLLDTVNANNYANVSLTLGSSVFSTIRVAAADVRAVMAYHLAASLNTSVTPNAYQPNIRVFSTNISGTAGTTFIKTMVNSSAATHPGVLAQTTFTGPFGTGIKFTQAAPLTAPFTAPAANAVALDKHAVNGVYHIIDKVLMPQ